MASREGIDMTKEEAFSLLQKHWPAAAFTVASDWVVASILEAYMLGQKDGGEWREAIEDAAVVYWTLDDTHTPRQAVNALLRMVETIALDPRTSAMAQALVERGEREGLQRAGIGLNEGVTASRRESE